MDEVAHIEKRIQRASKTNPSDFNSSSDKSPLHIGFSLIDEIFKQIKGELKKCKLEMKDKFREFYHINTEHFI